MRDILYQNLTSTDKRRRDLFIQEMVEKDGFVACTQKRACYFIKKQLPFTNLESMQSWMQDQNEKKLAKPRHIFLIRKQNSKLGEDRLVCKIVGTLYVVSNYTVYHIVYSHIVRIDLLRIKK